MSVFLPPTSQLLPVAAFDAMISEVGQRVSWMKSHACPCTYAPTTTFGRLSTPGSAQRACKQCLGIGFYWDTPSLPFRAYISYMHVANTPDEPGVIMNNVLGPVQTAEPTITIPHTNPRLTGNDPQQPTAAWLEASTDDIFLPVDMLARYTAVLQVGGIEVLPYQQNLQIASSGAVTVWNPITSSVMFVSDYVVDGPHVTIDYPPDTSYMVEFQACPVYVVWKRAGGLAHTRPFGGGTVAEPKRFRLQTLDLWTRQRGVQSPATIPTIV